jgi:hypothetical protein
MMHTRLSNIFVLSLFVVSPVFSAPTSSSAVISAEPTVTIALGVIVGKTTTVSNQPSVTAKAKAYLGVPFAQSPPERFSPPVAAAAWSSPLQAQALKPACIQQFAGSYDTHLHHKKPNKTFQERALNEPRR